MEATDKFISRVKNEKRTGESCKKKMERSIETALLRNWLKKGEPASKKVTHYKKQEDGTEGQGNKEGKIIDLTEEDEVKDPHPHKKGEDRVVDILRGPLDEVLCKCEVDITRRDFISLSGSNYVNDHIITGYMKLIRDRNEAYKLPEVYACSTYLYTKLHWLGFEQGSRDMKNWIKEDLRRKEMIFVPIQKDDHWSLIAVKPKTKVIEYFDSILGRRKSSDAPRILKQFMEKYYHDKGESASFNIKIREDAPLQENGVDCGVFVCQYAERLAREMPLNFKQEDLKDAREMMSKELLEGRIKPEGHMRVQEKERWKSQKKRVHTSGKVQQSDKVKGSNSSKGKSETTRKVETDEGNTKSKEANGRRVEGRRERIKFPNAISQEWKRLDEDLTNLLKFVHCSPENKAKIHPKLIYNFCRDRFGVEEIEHKSQPAGPSKRQLKCKQLRQEINKLKRTYENAPAEEKVAINQLQQEKIKELRLKKRAESIKQTRKQFARNCNEFLSQPFDFSRKIIAPKPKGVMKSSKAEVEKHLHKAHSDQKKNEEREAPEDLQEYDEASVEFDKGLPSWTAFNRRLRKTRSKSAPGPNGVPYLVYKRCPGVARLLFSYLKGMWKKNAISDSWQEAEGLFIPKEDGATVVEKFRTVSLLNVEGKLYFGMQADRLVTYTLANGYIDTSIQKGGVPAVSGCMEHTAILSQLIREAKAGKKDLVVVWLDIANAYGSIPHSLIQLALRRAHVPEEVCKLVESYYADMKIRFTTKEFTTDWQRVEKGIITGCTLSVILFALSMTMLAMSVKEETKGPRTVSGQRQVSTRLFMDDIVTTTENMVQTKHLLNKLVGKLEWAELYVKPEKCRSLVIKKGKVSQMTPSIGGNPITSITEKPIKYLGKLYNRALNDKEQTEEVLKEAKQGLRKIGETKIPGRYKAWVVQHMLLPRLMWPLTIYNIPESRVEEIQRLITAHLKKWLGLPKSLSTACMYTRSGRLQLPYSELTEEVKAAKARIYTTFEESNDPCVRGAELKVDGGRKADTPRSVTEAKSRLRMKEIVGIPNKGKEGLGLNPRKYYSSSAKDERRTMIVDSVREAEEDRRRVKMVSLAKQGAHTRWEVPEKKLSHREIISRSETSLKFLVKSVYDLLPTPANKNKWFGTEESCKLCGENGTMVHIQSGCRVALAQGRYRWRHDQVLRVIAHGVDTKRLNHNKQPRIVEKKIQFMKEGEKKTPIQKRVPHSYLDGAVDWKLMVDLDGNLKFPRQVAITNQRPDMILMSEMTKRIGLIELTVPSEERIEVSGELKRAKYAPLQEEGKANGWNVQVWAVEVGCTGF
ncbi:MAG: Ulp1 family isopeptidase, partial [Cyanobacteria bacterium J06582_2]